jgi:molybdenum cofactor guanylyltransferase
VGGGFAAVVLAGGAARRMAGADKAAVLVSGRPMRDRVLAAVVAAAPRVVVGPAASYPPGVLVTREDPPGGGPAAAAAAGLALLGGDIETVALLAADLPLLTPDAVNALRDRLRRSNVDGVVYVDGAGRRQLLCGVWLHRPLRAAVDRLAAARGTLAGASMRELLDGLVVAGIEPTGSTAPPWFDCDTDDDVRRAEEWAR